MTIITICVFVSEKCVPKFLLSKSVLVLDFFNHVQCCDINAQVIVYRPTILTHSPRRTTLKLRISVRE